MPEWAEAIGAFLRWLLKGCKTSLRDEVGGNFESTWGPSYDMENLLIGYVVVAIVIALSIWLIL
jgi:hypothetical protein